MENEKRHFTDPDDWIIVEGTHEPVVSRELFEEIRGLFRQKVKESTFSSQRGKDIPKQENKYLNLVFCGKCGKRLQMLSRLKEQNGKTDKDLFFMNVQMLMTGGKRTTVSQQLWSGRWIRWFLNPSGSRLRWFLRKGCCGLLRTFC